MIAIKTFHKRQNIANCLHFSQLTSDTPGVFVTREGDGVDWLPRALWGQRGAGECLFKDEQKRILISSWYSGPSPGTAQVPESDKDKERQGDHQAASPWAGQWLQVGLDIQLDIEGLRRIQYSKKLSRLGKLHKDTHESTAQQVSMFSLFTSFK